jgi:hypothetical protein
MPYLLVWALFKHKQKHAQTCTYAHANAHRHAHAQTRTRTRTHSSDSRSDQRRGGCHRGMLATHALGEPNEPLEGNFPTRSLSSANSLLTEVHPICFHTCAFWFCSANEPFSRSMLGSMHVLCNKQTRPTCMFWHCDKLSLTRSDVCTSK